MQTSPPVHIRIALTLLLGLGSAATAQTGGETVDVFNDPAATEQNAQTPEPESAGLDRNYPITLNAASLARKGATPNAGYVLLRDLKTLMQVSTSGQRVTIKTYKRVLVYTKGSRAATLNGKAARLNATPINTQETSLFPLAAVRLLGCTYEPLEAMKALRTYSVQCPGSDRPVQLQALTLNNKNAAATPLQFSR